jgi:Rha family phage regulatory protein
MSAPTIRDGFAELGIFEEDADAWVTSRDLARVFEKRHDDVIRGIRKTHEDVSQEFSLRNFAESKMKDSRGKNQPICRMTRKGFTLVAMGLTGKKAMEFKEAYIEAFENMAELIFSRIHAKEGYKKMTSAIARHLGGGKYVYAEEANIVNRAVLGMTSADFHEVHGLKRGETPRDAIVKYKLDQINDAQMLNAQLITAGVSKSQRIAILESNFKRRVA